ncbi:Intramolecular chaperone auto-processing domain containing protein [uncultured Caudovirales phage]|uniref:Intramolecular chaperone auto-processing domain containing protein n=1 Tax=uncultured Caudovirales phage TaxID=2100421 RepID=A0A6J5NEQ3_9CAUD|nr:Intramolecular chaperone auto-processing domain containing protein [uncultured Caudovirales phage]
MTAFGQGTQVTTRALNTAFANINASTLVGTTLAPSIVTSSLTSVGTITTGTWSGLFGAVSGANLTTLNASNLSSGTVASARLPSVNIGTTSVALSRASGALTLAGITLTSPTFTSPVLGTPTSGALTNCTLIPAGQLTGTFVGVTSSQTVEASLGALGTSLGNSLIHFKLTSTTSNGDYLLLTANRLAAGTNWETAAYTIQRLVDTTYMGFIRFGDGASGQNVQIGVNATKYLAVSSTATNVTGLLTADNIWNVSTATATMTAFNNVVRSTGTFPSYAHFTSNRSGKRNIVTITDSGSLIDQLNPVTYQATIDETDDELSASWKDRDLEYGFIAEEVAEVGTGFLAQYRDNGNGGLEPAGWKFHAVASVLVAEVKELRKRIKALETT